MPKKSSLEVVGQNPIKTPFLYTPRLPLFYSRLPFYLYCFICASNHLTFASSIFQLPIPLSFLNAFLLFIFLKGLVYISRCMNNYPKINLALTLFL